MKQNDHPSRAELYGHITRIGIIGQSMFAAVAATLAYKGQLGAAITTFAGVILTAVSLIWLIGKMSRDMEYLSSRIAEIAEQALKEEFHIEPLKEN